MSDISQDRLAWSVIVGEDAPLDMLANKLRMVAACGSVDPVTLTLHPSMVLPIARAFEAAQPGPIVDPSAPFVPDAAGYTRGGTVNDHGAARFEIDDYVAPVLGLIPVLGLALLFSAFLWWKL
jgi:hypothetical protein